MIRNRLKRTIYANGKLELLQMVSELDTGWYASEDVGPLRRWIVRSHICWKGEQNISNKGVETSP